MRILVYLLAFTVLGPFAWAQTAVEDESLVVCKNNRIVRTIRVNNEEDGSCKTIYTKSGVDRVVGSGKYTASCLQFLNNIKANLEGASWSCREVSKSKLTIVDDPASKQE